MNERVNGAFVDVLGRIPGRHVDRYEDIRMRSRNRGRHRGEVSEVSALDERIVDVTGRIHASLARLFRSHCRYSRIYLSRFSLSLFLS